MLKKQNRAMALLFAITLMAIAFLGFNVNADITFPATMTVGVLDESGVDEQLEDQKGYLGDTFTFIIDAAEFETASDLANITDNVTATLTVETTTPYIDDMFLMDWRPLADFIGWYGSWVADEVGIFDWEVNISDNGNGSNSIIEIGTIEVLPVPTFVSSATVYAFDEDTEMDINLSGLFEPEGLEIT